MMGGQQEADEKRDETTMVNEQELEIAGRGWVGRHLLDLEEKSPDALRALLRTATLFKDAQDTTYASLLRGKVVCNLFFEDSTRTRTSFSLAARKLGANVVEFTSRGSSISKGESFVDTARNLEALGADIVVVRHKTSGTPHLLTKHLQACVVNAGDGAHEHPTQGLLDIMTILDVKKKIEGLRVCLVGDISHSRVARSNIWGLRKLGAEVVVCGPRTLIPRSISNLGVEVNYDLDEVIPHCDVINILRIQFERQRTGLFPSIREYRHLFCVDPRRMALAKPDVLILAPGPINRGVEISPEVADGPNSRILDQVSNGLAVRMATLYLTVQQPKPAEAA
jgi:aspartate carbamoyltransferase catalytic subunit